MLERLRMGERKSVAETDSISPMGTGGTKLTPEISTSSGRKINAHVSIKSRLNERKWSVFSLK